MENMSKHPLRMVYIHMVERCYNKYDKHFQYYGGRGIKICKEWIDDRDEFYSWALPRWQAGLQIDRINNDGNYEPNNCRFVTPQQNLKNSRSYIKLDRRSQVSTDFQMGISITNIARKHQISRPTVYAILRDFSVK